MANKWINVYTGNPTAGKTDGIQVSTNNKNTAPIEIFLSADQDSSGIAKCAIRCEDGFKTQSGTVISFVGKSAAKWQIAADAGYTDKGDANNKATFSDTLTITDIIENTNIIFWVKASATMNELAGKDTSVSMQIQTTVSV